MEPKVRVIDGPVPTNPDGAVMVGGFGWYPGSVYEARVYVPSLVNGTRPMPAHRRLARREVLFATAKRLLEKDRAILKGLA